MMRLDHLPRAGLRSTRALSTLGQISATYRYDEFGQLLEANTTDPQPYLYSGEPRDLETGFTFLRARYYDPSIGRFMSRDRWPGVRAIPRTLSRYAYVTDNPLRFRDPLGLSPTELEPGTSLLDDSPAFAPAALHAQPRSYGLPDYFRIGAVIDPFHVGFGAQAGLSVDRYGNVYWQFVGLSASTPEAPRFSLLPFGVSATAGWMVAAGVPTESTTRSFLTGPAYSTCAAFVTAVCDTLSPTAEGISKFAVEGGLGTPDASFSGGLSDVIGKLPLEW